MDSSTEEEDEDVDAVVLQLPPRDHAPAPPTDTPAHAAPDVLAFAQSPTGVLVPKEPRPGRRSQVFKLGDYGTMRQRGRKHLHYFVSGFGYTPEYAAPEALRHGTARAHAPSDLWSVGVTLLELLLGRLPMFAVSRQHS